jgi:manganese oxidase
MFTTMKVREGLARDDYRDPGAYKFPQGTVAYEIDAPQSEPPRQAGAKDKTTKDKTTKDPGSKPMEMKGMKGM